jgi:beta-catenin-like protein 1
MLKRPREGAEAGRVVKVVDADGVEWVSTSEVEFAPDMEEQLSKLTASVADLDESVSSKRLVAALERKMQLNSQARIKHAGDAAKFIETESDLYEQVVAMQVMINNPSLIPEILDSNCTNLMVQLLVHENSDISLAVVEFFRDIFDPEILEELDEAQVANMVALAKSSQVAQAIVANLARFNENLDDDAKAVYSSMEFFEGIFELDPSFIEYAGKESDLIPWLIKRLLEKPKAARDDNRQYASEILSIMVQESTANQCRCAMDGGIDSILKAISYFRKADPTTENDKEAQQNIFTALRALLLVPANCVLFVKSEGIELMLMLVRRTPSIFAIPALKVIAFAAASGEVCCNSIVDASGLSILFPIFLSPAVLCVGKAKVSETSQINESVSSIMCSLLRFCKNEKLVRVVNKFREESYVKAAHAAELFVGVYLKVQDAADVARESSVGELWLDSGLRPCLIAFCLVHYPTPPGFETLFSLAMICALLMRCLEPFHLLPVPSPRHHLAPY